MLTGVDHTMEIMTEETFGPTLPIMKVRDADEAVRARERQPLRAQLERVLEGRREGRAGRPPADAGNACVNDALMNYLALEAPFGGTSESGLGARHGAPGIRKYCADADDPGHPVRAQARADDVPEHGVEGEGVRAPDGVMWGAAQRP